MSWVGINPV